MGFQGNPGRLTAPMPVCEDLMTLAEFPRRSSRQNRGNSWLRWGDFNGGPRSKIAAIVDRGPRIFDHHHYF